VWKPAKGRSFYRMWAPGGNTPPTHPSVCNAQRPAHRYLSSEYAFAFSGYHPVMSRSSRPSGIRDLLYYQTV